MDSDNSGLSLPSDKDITAEAKENVQERVGKMAGSLAKDLPPELLALMAEKEQARLQSGPERGIGQVEGRTL